jgi:5-methylcytosine-specific restriction endonuclease McrA
MKTRTDYPANWDDIRQAAYQRAGWRCEHCGMVFIPGTTQARYAKNRDGKPSTLTVHHLNGDTHDNRWENLLAACQACHLHIQGTWKPGGMLPWPEPPQWLIERGLDYQRPPVQLAMFEEMRP